ncbi:uncharacterized protein LOC131653996 [Vicia villosa]|uniref:uncharacterized protein LOC131653996 n=1 Tax=Vicia villosa TaxID=3911 RepID=UPI00273C0FD9|nr:uncharacterized protein LOC131653996 [Vicia villosa]
MEGRADIFLIQESKLEFVDMATVRSFWNNEKVGWYFSKSIGSSGGIISLWKEDSVDVILSFKGEGFLGIKVKKLWSDLLEAKSRYTDNEWFVAGDFNSISDRSERKGCSQQFRNSEISYFVGFIEESNLVDVPTKGKRFSWFGGEGRTMSRLDRFLVSENMIKSLDIVGQKIGNRDISDHYLVWLIVDGLNWGPKSNRVNKEWFGNKGFLDFVESEWKGIDVTGREDYILKEKLRILNLKLTSWNKPVFGERDLEIEQNVQIINEANNLLASCREEDTEEVIAKRCNVVRRMSLDLRLKENMILQKSGVKWDNEGDCNNIFFHKILKERRRRNFIGMLSSPIGLLESVEEVKEEVRRFFSESFEEEDNSRPLLEDISFKSLSQEESNSLELIFLNLKSKKQCGVAIVPRVRGQTVIISSSSKSFGPS